MSEEDPAARLARLKAKETAAGEEIGRYGPLTIERSEAFGRWFAIALERLDLEDAIAEGFDPASVLPVSRGEVAPVLVWARKRRRERPNRIDTTLEHGTEPLTNDALGRTIRRLTGRAGGRPPELTTIQDDAQLTDHIRAMRRDRVGRITQRTLAARSGFTEAEIRGYLRVTGRTWREFLSGF